MATGARGPVCDVRVRNSLRAYLQQVAGAGDAVSATEVPGLGSVEAMLVVRCDHGLVRCAAIWAVACEFLRDHEEEWDLDIHDRTCRSVRELLGVRTPK